MKFSLLILLSVLGFAGLGLAQAPKAKKDAAKPAMASKPAKLELTSITPRAAHIGGELLVSLAGKNFTEDTQAMASHPSLKVQLAKESIKASSARLKITAGAEVPRGAYDVWLKNASGESAKLKMYADEIQPTVTKAADFKNGSGEPHRLARERVGHADGNGSA